MKLLKTILERIVLYWKMNFAINGFSFEELELLSKDKLNHKWNGILCLNDKHGNTITKLPLNMQLKCYHSSRGIILEEEWLLKVLNAEAANIHNSAGFFSLHMIEEAFFKALYDGTAKETFDYSTKKFVPKDLKRLDGTVDIKNFLT